MCIHPKTFFTAAELKKLDQQAIKDFGMPGVLLMEHAGMGVVQYLNQKSIAGQVVVCCGVGNNGGDGLVVARMLWNQGVDVVVLLCGAPNMLSPDAKINYDIASRCQVPLIQVTDNNVVELEQKYLSQAQWIIDALLGIGLRGSTRMIFSQMIQAINQTKAKVVSIDIPSGLNADTGESMGHAVKANLTLSFVGQKKGFLNPMAQSYLGSVEVLDIGLPRVLFDASSLIKTE